MDKLFKPMFSEKLVKKKLFPFLKVKIGTILKITKLTQPV